LFSEKARYEIGNKMKLKPEKFNLRAYGILIKDEKILLAKECINDFCFTKFPGGGVEHGEGIAEALQREWMEETGVQLNEMTHYYTTDFFQVSAFNPVEQLISVYYKVSCEFDPLFYSKDESSPDQIKKLELNWQALSDFKPELLTFPIDKLVSKKILSELNI
jgi:8-oxo-dGTP diphosphatase